MEDLSNQKFNYLTVIRLSNQQGSVKYAKYWECVCDCGGKRLVNTYELTHNKLRTCKGCKLIGRIAHNKHFVGDMPGQHWASIKHGATGRNIPVEMTQEDAWNKFVEQGGKCNYTGLELEFVNEHSNKQKTASLDRINNEQGYNLENTQWIHKTVNMMKREFSEKEFLYLCKLVSDYNRSKSIGGQELCHYESV